MYIYKQLIKYDEDNGTPYSIWGVKEYRCDFTGKLIDSDENSSSYPNYILGYGDSDPCFGSCGEEYEFGEKYHIPMYEFLSNEYMFLTSSYDENNNYYDENNNYIDINACAEMIKSFTDKNMSFDEMCRSARIKTAEKLILNKTIKPEQLYSNHNV